MAKDVSQAQPWFEARTLVKPCTQDLCRFAAGDAEPCAQASEMRRQPGTAMARSSDSWVGDDILKERVRARSAGGLVR